MASDSNLDFATQLAALLASEFMEVVKKTTQSKKIKNSLFVLVDSVSTTGLVVAAPYWAQYYHNGRGAVTPKSASVLVWFKNPDLDPRIPTGGAIRATDVRRLTKQEFIDAREAGLLIISNRAGPAAPHPFFTDAEPEFFSRVDSIAAALLTDTLRSAMPTRGEVETVKASLRIRF